MPDVFEVSATTADGEVMAVRHRELPLDGVQFHPESVLTPLGRDLARNFLEGGEPVIQSALARLLDGENLTRAETREVMGTIMAGDATPAQIGGFLVALRLKGETADEIAGAAEAMRAHVIEVRPTRTDLVDTAGTGGDGANTFNISTAAALVAAAAGAGVAKHGNRAVSSASGSADVLEELGFRLELSAGQIAQSIDELGFGFMFAPLHHPAMRHAGAGPPRAGGPHRLQRARAAHQPGRRARPDRGRLLAAARAGDRRRARQARRAPRVRRPRRRRHRRALAGRAEPRVRGGRRGGAPSARSTR